MNQTMRTNKFSLIFTIFFLFSEFSFSQNYNIDLSKIFNKKLSDSEKTELLGGKIIYKNIKNASNISLLDKNDILSPIKQLKPNYLAEIIQIIPVSKKQNLLTELYKILTDIPSYKGIPYYSEHNDIWVDLYSEAKILQTNRTSAYKSSINAEFYMDPFETIFSRIDIDKPQVTNKNSEYLFYQNVNTSNIMYHEFTCIKPEKMKSLIYVYKADNFWILYGIGGLNAPKVPFLSSRIELSFMNRIKTFCNFVFTKLNNN